MCAIIISKEKRKCIGEKMKWYKYDIRDLTDSEFNRWYALMGADKQQRVDGFRFTDDKKRSVVGEMLARKAISEWCSVAPESIVFGKKERGKPYAEDLAVEFNISHSGDMVVCAVDDMPVGIDIERIRPIDLKLAKRVCTTEEELLFLFGHPPTEQDFVYTVDTERLTRFFKLWTAKEAYGKCIGKGVCFGRPPAENTECVILDKNYVISLCVGCN